MTSRVLRRNSGSSSRKSAPLCECEISPGPGLVPPPSRPASLMPEINRCDITLGCFYKSADFYLGLACLEPEASIAQHQHGGEDEAYYILEGRAEVTIGSTTAWVAPGTYVSIPKGFCHIIPAGRESVRYYVAASPPVKTRAVSGANIVFECLANLPLGGW
jgi:mannose-6-phosphate isomerase-like protein (cupin superfamily)